MNDKKIVILTATFGMGHHSVSKALKAEIERVYFDYTIDIVDIFDIIKPSYKKIAQGIYNYLTREFETLYNFFYNYKKDNRKNIIDELLYARYNRRFKAYMDTEKPSIVISTFPMTSGFMSRYKIKHDMNIPLMTVITDVVDSWEWVHEETDQYFVPSIEVKDLLRLKGVDKDSIFVTGIPVGADFKVEKSSTTHTQKKQVLIMASAMGKVKFDEAFIKQLESVENTKFIIVTGTDYELATTLSYRDYKNIQVLGYVSNIAELMEASDLIYTKPGGVTLFEAINKEIPLLIQQTTIGQEHANIAFIKNREIGIVLDRKTHFVDEIENIINDEVKLFQLKSNMYELKKEFKDEAILRAVR
ncbi:glycosyltransferase [Fusibacter sp. 3D3]|uniref:MGDG synthase family glycosyltransferase n=1 Tax=Fusibacter sp. 3D3 TaxID=1048380 RepID=UPI00085376C4|nr:glycosyltransferase [Fusibacter sp. 3D3]GAU77622.1 diglucosyldiacylglycerol synthase [Fusibacter sp. 3D3]